jgi:alpha-N-arabinofuranosidase
MSGNFTLRDDFDGPRLPLYWMSLRGPEGWPTLESGALLLRARADGLGDFARPSYIGRRQQHQNASASTVMRFAPAPGQEAGLVAFQNDE